MKKTVLVMLLLLHAMSLAAQEPLFPLADSRGITAAVQYPAAWAYTVADAPGFYLFATGPGTMEQEDPFALPDFDQLTQSQRPFVLAALADEGTMGDVDWLKSLFDLAESPDTVEGHDLLRSGATTVYDSPGRLLVFNDADTGLQGYVAAARTQDGQAALFLAFCPVDDAAEYQEVFAAMQASFVPSPSAGDMYGYARVQTGNLSIHKPGHWSAFHVAAPRVEIAMFAEGELDFASFKDFDTDMVASVFPLAMVMRGPAASLLGGDAHDARDAVDQLIASLGSTDEILSQSSVDMSGTAAERIVANVTIDTSDAALPVGLYAVVSLSPEGEARIFLGFAPRERFEEARRQFEEMSASLFFQEAPRG